MARLVIPAALGALLIQSPARAQQTAPENPGYEPVANYPNSEMAHAGTALGQFALLTVGDHLRIVCTAFAVAPDLVFTARHCLHPLNRAGNQIRDEDLLQAQFLMGRIAHQDKQETYILKSNYIAAGKGTQPDDWESDYVVFESTRPFPTTAQFPRLGKEPTPNEKLNLLHYPEDEQQLQNSMDHCKTTLLAVEGHLIRHECMADQMSSGAPIFDEFFNVIGIHVRSGFDPRVPNSANLGVLMSHVLADHKELVAHFKGSPRSNNIVAGLTGVMSQIPVDFGNSLLQTNDGWFIQKVNGGRPASKLSPQQFSTIDPTKLVLWDSAQDRLYEIPKSGGDVRSRLGSNAAWQTVGRTNALP